MMSTAATPTTMPAIAPPERGCVRLRELPGRVVADELEADMVDVGRTELLELEVEEDEDELVDDVIEEEVIDDNGVGDDADRKEEMVPGKGKGMVVAPLDTGLLVAAVSMLGIGILK